MHSYTRTAPMAFLRGPGPPSPSAVGIQRGNYNWTFPGPFLLILGHAASIALQHALITADPFKVHIPPCTQQPSLWFWPWPSTILPSLPTLFLSMTAVLVVKQAVWVFYIANEALTLGHAAFSVLSVLVYEGLCALVFSTACVNPLWTPQMLYAGALVHVVAAGVELGTELQRKGFKEDAGNGGKLCASGLWGVVRHPNYACNVVYAAAGGVATGGPLFVVVPLAMYLGNFVTNAIPPKEEYLARRYGVQWERYMRVVRWKLCPGVH